MFTLFPHMLHFTAFRSPCWLTYCLHIPLNIAYSSMKYRNTYPINIFYKDSSYILFHLISRSVSSSFGRWDLVVLVQFLPSQIISGQIIYLFSPNFQLLSMCFVLCDSCLFKKILSNMFSIYIKYALIINSRL